MLRDAKKKADESKNKASVTWRGYKTSVLPNLPPFTVKTLRDRLIWALHGIYNLRTSERELLRSMTSTFEGKENSIKSTGETSNFRVRAI